MQTISISRLVKTYLMTFFMHLMSLIYYFFLLLWQSNQLCRSSTVCHQIKSFSISRNNCLFIIHSKNWSFLKELIRCSACFSAARIIPSPACFSSEYSNNNGMRHKNNRPLQGWLFYFPSFLLPEEWSHFTLDIPWLHRCCKKSFSPFTNSFLSIFWEETGNNPKLHVT